MSPKKTYRWLTNTWKNSQHHSLFSSVQSLSCVRLFATPRITACQASLSIANSRSSPRLTSLEKCKSKLQWDIISHQSEWPSPESLQTINAGEDVEKREHSCTWWDCKLIQPLWKTVWGFLKKLGIKLPYDPAIPLLGIYPEETKIEKDTCIPLFTTVLFKIARTK